MKSFLLFVLIAISSAAYAALPPASVNVKTFGAKGNCTTPVDDTTAIQNAINAAGPIDSTAFAGEVIFPPGCYLITSPLNATNTRVGGTYIRDGLTLTGAGRSTVLIGKTGAGKAMIETAGSQFLRMKGFLLTTSAAYVASGQSTIAIQQGVGSTLQQTQNQHYEDVQIQMHDDAAANSGVGTVAIWNFGSEETTYQTMYLQANVAVILTSSNDGNQPGPHTLTSYQTLKATNGLGMTTFSGETFMLSLNRRNAPVIIQNIGTSHWEHVYISNSGAGGSNVGAIRFLGNAVNMVFHGMIEGLEALRFDGGGIFNSNLNIVWPSADDGAQPVIQVLRTSASGIQNSKISLTMPSPTRKIFSTTDGDETTTAGEQYYVADSEIAVFTEAGGPPAGTVCYMPVNVAKNASSVRWKLTGCEYDPSDSTCKYIISGDTANLTGDGTRVISSAVGWTKVIDTGGVCNTSGGFLAKMNGKYLFSAQIELSGIAVGHDDAILYIFDSANDLQIDRKNAATSVYGGLTQATVKGSVIVDMLAGQDAYPVLKVSGGAKAVGVLNGVLPAGAHRSHFSVKKLN